MDKETKKSAENWIFFVLELVNFVEQILVKIQMPLSSKTNKSPSKMMVER